MLADVVVLHPARSVESCPVDLVVLYDGERAIAAGPDLRSAQLEALRAVVAAGYAFTPEEYIVGLRQVAVTLHPAAVSTVRMLLGLAPESWGGPHAA